MSTTWIRFTMAQIRGVGAWTGRRCRHHRRSSEKNRASVGGLDWASECRRSSEGVRVEQRRRGIEL